MSAIGDVASSPALLPSGLRSGRNPREVATQFEALLLKEMVAAMRKTTMLSDEESGGQLVDHLIEDALASHLAKSGGVGLADLVVDQVDEPQRVTPTDMQLHLERWVRDSLPPSPVPQEIAPEAPGEAPTPAPDNE